MLYDDLYEDISAILFEHDPVGLNFGHNTDEYEPEVDTILPRLENAYSVADVRRIIFEELCYWVRIAGQPLKEGEIPSSVWPEHQYQAIAEDIWEAMQEYGLRDYDDYDPA